MSDKSVFSSAAEQDLTRRNASPESIASGQQLATVGQQLRAAREARGLSVADAAQSLKLGPRQVIALESEDWSSLPGNTMIRGFVRNYARLLNLDADALMRGLDAEQMQRTLQLNVSAGTSASLPQAGRQAERRDYLAIFAGLLLLTLALIAYLYVPQDFWEEKLAALTGSSTQQASVEPASTPAVAATPAVVTEPPAATPSVSATTADATPVAPNQVAATIAAVPGAAAKADLTPAAKPQPGGEQKADAKPAATAAGNSLKLRFAQPAWIEVRDGRDEVLVSGFRPADSEREITGQPPFSLVLGNAKHVTVEYNGKPIDLEPHISKGVARLTLK
ncbi:MAG: helix-turn-helix domain-containing protein [Candidatus Accumulibacter sp.]|uniref:RodZ domain-containing protein n=1 Tax=Accumulibacter sp. TaxID=2053492 RepID=UPI0025F65083|nr:RodZ domain-containing protein [Accumulibacter sp.]MCP5249013.1 helix-turn-helix domain-containing protein [Accumulibacter sp.]